MDNCLLREHWMFEYKLSVLNELQLAVLGIAVGPLLVVKTSFHQYKYLRVLKNQACCSWCINCKIRNPDDVHLINSKKRTSAAKRMLHAED